MILSNKNPISHGGRNELSSMDHLRSPCWLDRKHRHGKEQTNGCDCQYCGWHHRRVYRRLDHEFLRRAGCYRLQLAQVTGCDCWRSCLTVRSRVVPPLKIHLQLSETDYTKYPSTGRGNCSLCQLPLSKPTRVS